MKKMIVFAGLTLVSVFASCEKDELIPEPCSETQPCIHPELVAEENGKKGPSTSKDGDNGINIPFVDLGSPITFGVANNYLHVEFEDGTVAEIQIEGQTYEGQYEYIKTPNPHGGELVYTPREQNWTQEPINEWGVIDLGSAWDVYNSNDGTVNPLLIDFWIHVGELELPVAPYNVQVNENVISFNGQVFEKTSQQGAVIRYEYGHLGIVIIYGHTGAPLQIEIRNVIEGYNYDTFNSYDYNFSGQQFMRIDAAGLLISLM